MATTQRNLSKNGRMVVYLLAAFLSMCALVAVAVPLYKAFCPTTTQTGARNRVANAPKVAANRIITVHFDSNTNAIPWTFKPDQPSQRTRVGKTAMMYFTITNHGDRPITGRATYNVLPVMMHAYFMKLQCFCFTDMTLLPGESRHLPVVYFLDPELMKNRDLTDMPDVTLSYTFFEVKGPASNSVKK